MKRILFTLLVAVIGAVQVEAQTMYFSTSTKQECWWNTSTEKFDKCSDEETSSSLFKLNSDQTMFHHTTNSISSDYYVTKKEYDKDNDVYTYDVKSDVGNTYFFVIDIKNNQIRIVGNNKSSSSKTYMHVYTLKKAWTD